MAKFLSKCKNQVLCIRPNRVQIVEGIPVPVPGEHIRFDRGEYNTDDKKEIAFLRKHPLLNVSITEAEEPKIPKNTGQGSE